LGKGRVRVEREWEGRRKGRAEKEKVGKGWKRTCWKK